MHLALWNRLDIFTASVVLPQYQKEPPHIHIAAVKQMVGYLGLHPALLLVFDQSHFMNMTVGCFDIEIDQVDPLKIHFPGPKSYHVASVQLL
jgi:hypothetical protein